MTGATIAFLEIPRNEAEENELEVENTGLLRLGLEPTRLKDELMREVTEVARRYADRCRPLQDPLPQPRRRREQRRHRAATS